MKKKIVVALGGNALGNSPQEQLKIVKNTAKSIVDLVVLGNQVVIVHGNGPQVGMINLAFDNYSRSSKGCEMPFPECGAMSQGYIGYHLQNSIRTELLNRNMNKNVQTLITQIVVDKNDKAFDNPTKPIGNFYTEIEAKKLIDQGIKVKEDSGRGYRRVIASPRPLDIIEKKTIELLIENDDIVICAGGGGIPVIKKENELIGIAAVIDKDFASEKLAELIDADMLIILTAVDRVCINYNKENEQQLEEINLTDIEKYINENQFAPGSMLPKVQAALEFVKSGKKKEALITSLEKVSDALEGKTGTIIKN